MIRFVVLLIVQVNISNIKVEAKSGNEGGLINDYLDIPPEKDLNIKCSYINNSGKIVSTIQFLRLLNKINVFPNNSNEDTQNNYLKKYLIEINYNIIDVLNIDDIFYKDIIENDIKKEFLNQDPKNCSFIFSNSFF